MALRRPIGVLPRALVVASLAGLTLACSAEFGPPYATPSPTPTAGLSEVDLLFNVAQDYPPQVTRIGATDTVGPLNLVLTTGLTVGGHVGTGAGLDPLPEGAIIRAVGADSTSSAIEQTANVDTGTGTYTLQLVPGVYDFIVTPRDNVTPSEPDKPIAVFPAITINAASQTQDFELPAGIRVNGQVLDSTGGSVGAGFRVDAFGNQCLGSAQSATTDVNGAFAVDVPCADAYNFRVTPPDGALGFPMLELQTIDVSAPMQRDLTYAPGFPGAGTVQVTGTVNVGAGEPAIPNFAAMTVRATSVALDNDPGTAGETYEYRTNVSVQSGGAFTLSVSPGTYTIRILPEKDDPFSDKVLTDVVVGLTPIALPDPDTRLVPKSEILGRVDDPDGRAVPGVIVRYESSSANGTGYTFSSVTDASGTYTLSVNQGQYDVSLVPPADSALVRNRTTASVTTGSADPFDFTLDIGKTVTGTLFGDAEASTPPVPSVLIQVLDPTTGASVGADDGFTGSDGTYLITIPNLVP